VHNCLFCQVDSGQTIATISRDHTGSTVATLNDTSEENAVDIAVGEVRKRIFAFLERLPCFNYFQWNCFFKIL